MQWEDIYRDKDAIEISKDFEERISKLCHENLPKKTQKRARKKKNDKTYTNGAPPIRNINLGASDL